MTCVNVSADERYGIHDRKAGGRLYCDANHRSKRRAARSGHLIARNSQGLPMQRSVIDVTSNRPSVLPFSRRCRWGWVFRSRPYQPTHPPPKKTGVAHRRQILAREFVSVAERAYRPPQPNAGLGDKPSQNRRARLHPPSVPRVAIPRNCRCAQIDSSINDGQSGGSYLRWHPRACEYAESPSPRESWSRRGYGSAGLQALELRPSRPVRGRLL
jgi:hypothetical protein